MIGNVEITVVVGDHDDGFAQALKVRQQFGVENPSEGRVLVGRPFVKHQHRALFQPGVDQGQALALPGREVGGAEPAVGDADLVRNFQALEVLLGVLGDVHVALHHVIEQVVVGKNGGEQLPIVIAGFS